ncbi:MAG: hypothetical protein EZS28_013836, partial [Streblomastix strix]
PLQRVALWINGVINLYGTNLGTERVVKFA